MAPKDENARVSTETSPISLPSRATGLPTDSHLKGSDNYAVWSLQMETVVGDDAFKVMNGDWKKGDDYCTEREWLELDSHARKCITLSCSQEVMKEVTGIPKTSYSWWSKLRNTFQPNDAQGHHRLLSRLFNIVLSHASPESLKTFTHEYLEMVAQVHSEEIKVDEILSSQLLSVLPASLSHFQTSLALTYPDGLPEPRTILELLRNEVERNAPVHSVALAAHSSGAPPRPYPACKENHWMKDCPRKDLVAKYYESRKRKPSANLATSPPPAASTPPSASLADLLNTDVGVEAWLAGHLAKPSQLTLDSGSTHFMCGDRSKFSDFLSCTPTTVGGISKTSLKVLGVGSLTLRLVNGRLVRINQVLFVPGIATTLISSSKLFDLHGITSEFGKGANSQTRQHHPRHRYPGWRISLLSRWIPRHSLTLFRCVCSLSHPFVSLETDNYSPSFCAS